MLYFLIKTVESGEHLITASTEEKAQRKIDMYAKYETIINITKILAKI